jgi:hypothetical protein
MCRHPVPGMRSSRTGCCHTCNCRGSSTNPPWSSCSCRLARRCPRGPDIVSHSFRSSSPCLYMYHGAVVQQSRCGGLRLVSGLPCGNPSRDIPETQSPFERQAWPCATVSNPPETRTKVHCVRQNNMWIQEHSGCKLATVSERRVLSSKEVTNQYQASKYLRWERSSRQRRNMTRRQAPLRVLWQSTLRPVLAPQTSKTKDRTSRKQEGATTREAAVQEGMGA